MQSIVGLDAAVGLAVVLATGMDAVVVDVAPEEEDVPATLLMVLMYQTPIAVLQH